MQASKTKSGLGVIALVLLITGAIDSIRNLPATALFGPALIFFFLFSAVVFLIPVALVSARLSSACPKRGGIYQWVHWGLGSKWAFLAVWLQWINTIVWFPTILSFIAATAAWLIDPQLANNRNFLIGIILSLFWIMTLINLRGVHTSARFANFCSILGMILPMGLIMGLAVLWIISGQPLQVHFTVHNMLPSLSNSDNWIALTAIMTAFLGMELATVHVREVRDPQQAFPKALFFSVILILATMILGSLAIALVLPHDQISLVGGVMQAFSHFLAVWHLTAFTPVLAIMLLIGSIGGMTSWIISPVRGLLQAAEEGYLPRFFSAPNRHHVPARLLLLQACLVTLVCLAFLLMPSVNGSYWLLTDLSTQLYILMYVLMFAAGLRLDKTLTSIPNSLTFPFGRAGAWLIGLLGLLGCGITLGVGFIPPAGLNVGGALHYEIMFCGGMLVMLAPVLLFYLRHACQQRKGAMGGERV